MIFKDDPDRVKTIEFDLNNNSLQILQCWDYWLSSIDCMFEKALLVNLTNSLEQISFMINGDIQTTPTPFLNIELGLNTIETINGNIKYKLTFRPSLEEFSEMLNSISKSQLIESIQHFVRLCDLFSYHPFQREVN